jgi:hypothetical protein
MTRFETPGVFEPEDEEREPGICYQTGSLPAGRIWLPSAPSVWLICKEITMPTYRGFYLHRSGRD